MGSSLAIISESDFSREKVELIKRTICVGGTDDELALFLYTCKRTGLDPLARQIYAVKRAGKMAIQTGIDGYRLIADRTGNLAGISDYLFDSEEGKTPGKATVTVKKLLEGGTIADFTATARWGEYCAGGPMWTKMPYLMLGKCAEALALRKAFPADLSGVYTTEEMAQADNEQQGAAVHAEVARQKDDHLEPSDAPPPELDWSYQGTTGVLICRLVSVESRKKKGGKGEYLTVKVNGQVGGKFPEVLTYFHESHRDLLLASVGKIAKLVTEVSGDFANIISVAEVDGRRVEKPAESDETKARLLASTMDFEEEELRELYSRYCNSNWSEVLVKLEAEKERRDNPDADEPAGGYQGAAQS